MTAKKKQVQLQHRCKEITSTGESGEVVDCGDGKAIDSGGWDARMNTTITATRRLFTPFIVSRHAQVPDHD